VFGASTESRNGVTRIALRGEMDLATAPIFNERLAESNYDGGSALLLDLRELTFVDIAALRALLGAKAAADTEGSVLILVGVRSCVRRLFELTGSEDALDGHAAAAVINRFTGGSTTWVPRISRNRGPG
jgi:anti-anti-sigma factor